MDFRRGQGPGFPRGRGAWGGEEECFFSIAMCLVEGTGHAGVIRFHGCITCTQGKPVLVSLRCTGCTYTCVCPQSPRTGWAGLAFPIRAAPTGALASVMEGTFLSSGILLWNSGPCQPVPCLLTINYLIYIH